MTLGKDLGVIEAHLEKINHFILPQAFALKDKVDKGSPLNDFDLDFLEEVFAYHRSVLRSFLHHPEFVELSTHLSALYTHIVEKAAQNEENGKGS